MGFDPDCLYIPNAIKSIWLAYKRGHWEVLRKLGLKREDIEEVFNMFDALRIARSPGLRGLSQVLALLRAYPPLIDAAVRLVGLYMISYDTELEAFVRTQPKKGYVHDTAHQTDISRDGREQV